MQVSSHRQRSLTLRKCAAASSVGLLLLRLNRAAWPSQPWSPSSRITNSSAEVKQGSSDTDSQADKALFTPPPPAPELGITSDTDRIAGLSISDDLFARWYALAAAPRQVNGTPTPNPPLAVPPVAAVAPTPPVWTVVSKRDSVVRSASVSAPLSVARVPAKMTSTPWARRGSFAVPPRAFPSTAGLTDHSKGVGSGPRAGLSAWNSSSTAAWSSSSGSAWGWGRRTTEEWSGGLEPSLLPEHRNAGREMEWGIPCYPSAPSPCSLPAAAVPGLCVGQSACGAGTAACSMGWFVWYPYPYYSYIS